ncbi:MAG: NUDIX hydrolase [Thermodesulfobacteriota bacterium]|nr:NUDIX hydrolase [Thermodesulfobacteriota bacterium]
MTQYRNPVPTVDIIIETQDGIVLVERRNPPHGWALPGGFVDYGESLENAAVREAAEETGLDVMLVEQFHAYSAPDRDPRQHTLTVVFIARADGRPVAGDDAGKARVFAEDSLPDTFAFDHKRIVADYFRYRRAGVSPNVYEAH